MTATKKGIWGFPEEQQPGGEAGKLKLYDFFPRNQQAKTLQAIRVKQSPWFIVIWEKLKTGIPDEAYTIPYCCYINTVIFYKRPYQVDESGRNYAEWARVDATLRCDDVVDFENERFEVGTGQVRYENAAWWMCMWARRNEKRD